MQLKLPFAFFPSQRFATSSALPKIRKSETPSSLRPLAAFAALRFNLFDRRSRLKSVLHPPLPYARAWFNDSCRGVFALEATAGAGFFSGQQGDLRQHAIPAAQSEIDLRGDLGADLTYQGELGDFWQQPRKPLGKLYESFYNHVVLAFATLPVWFPLLAAWVIIDPFYRVSVWKSQRLEASLKPSSPKKSQALEEHLAMPAE